MKDLRDALHACRLVLRVRLTDDDEDGHAALELAEAALEAPAVDLEAIKDAFLDLLGQHCGEWKRDALGLSTFAGYDSGCLSANEHALDLAATLGWIKREEITR